MCWIKIWSWIIERQTFSDLLLLESPSNNHKDDNSLNNSVELVINDHVYL